MVKRYGNLWKKVIDKDNFLLAYQKSKKGKSSFTAVKRFEHNWEEKLEAVRQLLVTKTFHTAPYNRKTVYEPKERIIYVCLLLIVMLVSNTEDNIKALSKY